MDTRKLALPLLAFAGGAILGRVFGLTTLARGAVTAAAVTGMARQPALVGLAREAVGPSQRRRSASRPARKRVTQKKSRPV